MYQLLYVLLRIHYTCFVTKCLFFNLKMRQSNFNLVLHNRDLEVFSVWFGPPVNGPSNVIGLHFMVLCSKSNAGIVFSFACFCRSFYTIFTEICTFFTQFLQKFVHFLHNLYRNLYLSKKLSRLFFILFSRNKTRIKSCVFSNALCVGTTPTVKLSLEDARSFFSYKITLILIHQNLNK